MAARIRSILNGDLITAVDEASRDDLSLGDVVTVQSLDAATTYAWAITFAPEGSTATFSGSPTDPAPGTFTVDVEGPYLIRLTVDVGLVTEDTQYVRLRYLTDFGQLTLVAAGERRDGTGIIPVDVDMVGWANEQNANVQTLKAFIKPLVSSGRLLYVDANDGTANYADHATVQAAIDDAVAQGASESEPWVVVVRPGRYVGNVTFAPWVHVIGWPGVDQSVVLEGTHTAALPLAANRLTLMHLHLETNANTTSAALTKTGLGHLQIKEVQVEANGTDAGQGPALLHQAGSLDVLDSTLTHTLAGGPDRVAFSQTGASTTSRFERCRLSGPSGVSLNSTLALNVSARFRECEITSDAGTPVTTTAASTTLEGSTLSNPGGSGVVVNPSASVFGGDVALTLRYSRVQDDIVFDTTNLSGATTLNLGAVEYGSLVYPGGPPDTQNALPKSRSHFYDDAFSGLGADNVQDAIDILSLVPDLAPLVFNKNIPEIAADSVSYRGWVPVACTLLGVRVRMMTVNTEGTYTLTVTNDGTTNSVIDPVTFDMNALVPGVVTAVPLTAVGADLSFPALTGWTVTLTSNDPSFNGSDIYVELVFNSSSGGGPVVEDLATTLLIGNSTGGTNLDITSGDVLDFGTSPLAPVSAPNRGRIRYNQDTGTFQTSVDGGAWSDVGLDSDQFAMAVVPDDIVHSLWFAPYNSEVLEIKVYGATTPTTVGTYTLAVEDMTATNNLLSAATFDMTSLVPETLTDLALTATTANLTLPKGTRVRFRLVSDNADLAASGIYLQIIYRKL